MPKENTRMPRDRRPGAGEKPKDFKKSMERLFKELSDFKRLILIACILAALGSILSIVAPNRLSNLTDEISKGLVVNTENITSITKEITDKVKEDNLKDKIVKILDVNIDEDVIKDIYTSNEINEEDKNLFKEILESHNFSSLNELPDSILSKILNTSYYDNIKITKEDKITLLKSSEKDLNIPESVQRIIFDDLTVDGIKISSKDQYEYLINLSSFSKDSKPEEIYKKIDEMPKSIQNVIKPKMNLNKIVGICIFLIILYLFSGLFSFLQAIIMANLSNGFANGLRKRISNKINKLPLKYFDKHLSGDILSRVTNDVDMIAQTMNQSLSSLVSSLTLFLGTLIMMMITNWIMALTAVGASLIGFFLMSLILKNSQKYFKQRQTELGNLNGHIEEIYSGLNVVKAYNGNEDADRKFDEYNLKVCESNKKSQFISGLMQPIMMFIGNLGYVCVCIVGALLTLNGNITFGVIVAFMIYVRLFTQPLSQIAQGLTSLQSAGAASERVFEFLDEKEMISEENTKALDKDKVKGDISFNHVSFTYDGNDKPTINDFSADIKAGQKIAIVGPTGAGKTTMVNLLMKFYEINSGDILIDGISTKNLTRENIHSLFTMVLQDTWLFDGTVKENVIFNREGVSDDIVHKVCEEVGVDHFIKTLPKGYDTVLKDNDSVSAGQRQLLTIARGMIESSPFLILDEATSNVDTRTEELTVKAMDKISKGKTSFIIAHRLSTIKNADLILVMDSGNIVEQGTHDELMEKNGFYANLYNSQFQK